MRWILCVKDLKKHKNVSNSIQELSSQLVWMCSLHNNVSCCSPKLKIYFNVNLMSFPAFFWKTVLFLSFFQSFLYRCVGVILQQCQNKELVKKQLQEILISSRHNDAIERTVHQTQCLYTTHLSVYFLTSELTESLCADSQTACSKTTFWQHTKPSLGNYVS